MNDRARLTRSSDRWLAGVCAGIAEFFGWRPAVIRMLWILVTVLSAGIGGLIAYAVLALIMPPPGPKSKFRLEDHRVQ